MKKFLFIIIILIINVFAGIRTTNYIKKITTDNTRLKANQTLLLQADSIKLSRYKVADSLNAIKINALQLSLEEYKKAKPEDYSLVKGLISKKDTPESLTDIYTNTSVELTLPVKDTIILMSPEDTLKYFNYQTNHIKLQGYLNLYTDSLNINIVSTERLKIVETVEYKRFLGFLWKTKKIKSKSIQALSDNPHTVISGCEYIRLEKQ